MTNVLDIGVREKSRMHAFLEYILKHFSVVQIIYRTVMSALFRLWGVFVRTDDKMILFTSYGGRQYSDSPKVLYEAIKRDSRFKGYRLIWAFEHPEQFHDLVPEVIKMDSIRYFYTALKAGIWVTNVNIERGLHFKKEKTIYLNTWHGTGPKKGGNAVKGRKDYDFSYVDILTCDGTYYRDIMIKWFNAFPENIIMCGRPREDELFSFSHEDTLQIKKKLNLPLDKKIILYMPTWREYGNQLVDWQKWQPELGDEYIVICRMHHFARHSAFDSGLQEFLFDGSKHDNINELYWISDVLISDYSSAFFDFGLLGKPIICYADDYEWYEKSYGLFMDLKKDFPGGVHTTQEQVIRTIRAMDYSALAEQCQKYVHSVVSHPGSATQECLDALVRKIEERNRVS